MPYIKQELRPLFDPAITLAQQGEVDEAAEYIILRTAYMTPKVMDGCLNYIFTQLLRKTNHLAAARIVINLTINGLFWKEPSYFYFERVKGLLGCMIDEYKRRGWKRQRKVVRILKKFLLLNKYRTITYEKTKIAENGDLE